ncbi:ABC transporter permease [Xanthomonas sp. MUS 060]|uniref:ABC transporter permease n=1 Tax=Xanthomonas sp. MUS 060 TaxID=1588031 RepID=UPI0005F27D4B|nr:ABC transporter permease [Xanthomonas sp. MUS 060]
MNARIRRITALAGIQAREFHRDFGTLFLNIIFPAIFVVAIIVTQMANPTLRFKIGVVETQRSEQNQAFVQRLAASPGLEVVSLSPARALPALTDGQVQMVLRIDDARFEQNAGDIKVLVGPRYEAFARILLESVRDRMRSERSSAVQAFSYALQAPDVAVRSQFSFTFPGLLVLALVQMGLFATAVPLLQARDRGTLRYLSLTPLSVADILIGQLAVRVVIALIQIVLILSVGSFVLELGLTQWSMVLGISLMGIVLMVGIGYAIAGLATNPQSGTALILICNFVMLMGGNVFLDARDSTLQYAIACAIPVSYLSDLYRQVITGESGVWPIWLDVLAILGFSVVAIAVAMRTFRFDNDRAVVSRWRLVGSTASLPKSELG